MFIHIGCQEQIYKKEESDSLYYLKKITEIMCIFFKKNKYYNKIYTIFWYRSFNTYNIFNIFPINVSVQSLII